MPLRSIELVTALLASLALGAAATPGAAPARLVRLPDGRALNLRCEGRGSPTVVFEGGFAATSLAWYKVQPRVAQTNRACSYDRAGYGFSDPGPLPRDGAATAKDLDDGLRAARVAGPFVLVGHSAGGLYMRLFADRRPRDVIGMVLVDPSIEHQDRRFAAVFGPGSGSVAPQRAHAAACLAATERHDATPSGDAVVDACTPNLPPSFWRTELSELDSLWGATSDEMDAGRPSYGAMPLIVLTADGTYAAMPPSTRAAVDDFWRALHREIAARSRRGVERRVDKSSHMVMFDQPDAIVQAIMEVISESKVRSETKDSG